MPPLLQESVNPPFKPTTPRELRAEQFVLSEDQESSHLQTGRGVKFTGLTKRNSESIERYVQELSEEPVFGVAARSPCQRPFISALELAKKSV